MQRWLAVLSVLLTLGLIHPRWYETQRFKRETVSWLLVGVSELMWKQALRSIKGARFF